MEDETIHMISVDKSLDPKIVEAVKFVKDLEGRVLLKIEVVPIGVLFHFGSKNGDNGMVYWAYGGPR